MLRRRRHPLSIRTKFLIVIAVAALPAGYFTFESSDRPVDVAVAPRSTADIPPVEFLPLWEAPAPAAIPPLEFLPLREAQAPAAIPPVEFLPLQAPTAAAVGTYAESRIEPEVQTAPSQPTVPLDIKPIENGIEARPPQTLPQKEGQSFAPSQDASICFPSASAVRQNYPEGWPSWTLRAPGHEGTRCWYPATRTRAHDHRSEIMPRKETVGIMEKLGSPGGLFGEVQKSSPPKTDIVTASTTPPIDTPPVTPAPPRQAQPSTVEPRGIPASIGADPEIQTPSTQTTTRSESRPNESDVTAQKPTPDPKSMTSESRTTDDKSGVPINASADIALAPNDIGPVAEHEQAANHEPPVGGSSGDAKLYQEQAAVACRNGDLEQAIAAFGHVIQLKPGDAQAYHMRGNLRDDTGDSDGALADYEQAIRLKPNSSIYHDRGILWQRLGAFDKAIVDLDWAIRFTFSEPGIYIDRGFVWFEKGRHDRAAADFDRAVKIDAAFASSYIDRGVMMHDNGTCNRGVRRVDRAPPIDPNILPPVLRAKLSQ